jgi:hypothetical protein
LPAQGPAKVRFRQVEGRVATLIFILAQAIFGLEGKVFLKDSLRSIA